MPLPKSCNGERIPCFSDRRGFASTCESDGSPITAIDELTRPALPWRFNHLAFYTEISSRLAYGKDDAGAMLIREVEEDGETEYRAAAIV